MTIQDATKSLDEFATQLYELAKQVDQPHRIVSTNSHSQFQSQSQEKSTTISIAEIALHSRDASIQDFQSPLAVAARQQLLVEAKQLQDTLRNMAHYYLDTVQPQMEYATRLCQETPCGGATWELQIDKLQEQAQYQSVSTTTRDGNQTVVLQGDHGTLDGTPCGRLQWKSLQFLETTLETKPQVVMASRAYILLSLAMTLQAPLQEIRKNGTTEQKRLISTTFQSQVVPTPWIRSDEEYQALHTIKKDLSISKFPKDYRQ